MAGEAAELNIPAWSEQDRLAALSRYAIMDTPPEPDFDAIVALAASLCQAPLALINLISDTRQWFKAELGFGVREAPFDTSICVQVLRDSGVVVVPDLAADDRFRCFPAVTDGRRLRFYAGCALLTPEGMPLGTLCVLDTEPRPAGLDERQRTALETLSRQVMTLLELRRAVAERDAHLAKLDVVLAQAPAGLSEVAPDGRFTAVNDRFCAMLARPRDEVLRLSVPDVVHPDDLARNLALLARAMQTGETFSLDKRFLRPDGTFAWVNGSVSPLLDEQGKPYAALAVTVDVTERKLVEARQEFLLALSDEMSALSDPRAIMAASAEGLGEHLGTDCIGYGELDETGEHCTVVQAWTRPGFPSVAGRYRLTDFGPALAAALWAGRTVQVDDVAASPLTAGAEAVFARIRARAVVRVPLPKSGPLAGVLFALSEQPRRWSVGDAALIEAVAERTRHAVERARAEAALRSLNAELGVRIERATAEREAVLARLNEAHRLESIGQLTGGIAHDFNNMLQGISGSLDLMRRRIAQGRAAEVTQYVEAAAQATDRAARLTHRLLAFARRQTLQPRRVEPDELVRGIGELIERTVGPGVAVELRLRDGAWSVLCDPDQLENVLLNLAINGRDAMPEGGRLTIGTKDVPVAATDVAGQPGTAPGDYVEISVADTGAGMDEATRARAFEPFFTTKPLGQGTGLGLSQLYGFVRQSGGFVRLDSAPGEGTLVRLYLPRHADVADSGTGSDDEGAAGDAASAAPGSPFGPAAATGTVLVVEDEPGVRAALVESLRGLGCRVLEAVDGPSGLDLLLHTGEQVDALVTDVGLPALNGRQLADAARERDPRLPVLLITGYAGNALDAMPLAPGMEVMAKPFALPALTARVAAMLKRRIARSPA